jgi:hydroxylysine kinase
MLEGLTAPFARLDEAAAARALSEHWGVEGTAFELLDTERDDTWRVSTGSTGGVSTGGAVTFKVAHPDDGPALIDLQNAALKRVAEAEPDLPVPRVISTLDGADSADVDGRIARALTWLPGELMMNAPRSVAQLLAAGLALGRLSRALAPLEHPAAHRTLPWDLRNISGLRGESTDAALDLLVGRFANTVEPALGALPQQVIHGDFHHGNVLVDPEDPDRIDGVLDFGDVAHTARVADLGVALAYLTPDDGSVWDVWQPFIDGFEQATPLLADERALIPALVAGRQLQRLVINEAMGRAAGETEIRRAPRIRRQLDGILAQTGAL